MSRQLRGREGQGDGMWAPLADIMTLVACVFLVVFLAAVLSHRTAEEKLRDATKDATRARGFAEGARDLARRDKETAEGYRKRLEAIEEGISVARGDWAKPEQGSDIRVDERTGSLILPEGLTFEPSGHELTLKGKSMIKEQIIPKIARVLRENRTMRVSISGHTDCTPYRDDERDINNWSLSLRRADAVLRVVLDSEDISKDHRARITATGRGALVPRKQPCTSDENRRVEIQVEGDWNMIQAELAKSKKQPR